jgi:pimeloyl-ACP methyl ester carboxylesterase
MRWLTTWLVRESHWCSSIQVATDRRLWHQQRLPLSARYRMITVDALGHGERLWPLKELSIERAATHIQWLLERLGMGAAFLIGVSMGAAVAMRLALDTPSLVRRTCTPQPLDPCE